MKSVKGTETEKNLLATFAGECQARMRYDYFSKVAAKEGYQQIAAIFAETAEQERAHAKRMFEFLEGGDVEITSSYPAGQILGTLENLDEAAKGEEHEYNELYPAAADTAEKEGFPEVARMYRAVIVAEKFHGNRFRALQENVKEGRVFKRDMPQKWRCRKCGYVMEGKEAPEICPACLHPQAYYEIAAENY